ncbi:response regulator transcription factor [Polynucleobacter arcticus]
MNANHSDKEIDLASNKNILVLGINKVYFSLLSIYLKNYLSAELVYASYDEFRIHPEKECFKNADLIIFEFDQNETDLVANLISMYKKNFLVFFKERHIEAINHWIELGVKGFFNENRSLDHLLEAVATVQSGKYYISHEDSEIVFKNLEARTTKFKQSLSLMTAINTLTKKEVAVVHAIASNEGSLLKNVSEKMFLSDHTLRNHLQSIYKKLNIRNRIDLYIFYQKNEAIFTEIIASNALSKSEKLRNVQSRFSSEPNRYSEKLSAQS